MAGDESPFYSKRETRRNNRENRARDRSEDRGPRGRTGGSAPTPERDTSYEASLRRQNTAPPSGGGGSTSTSSRSTSTEGSGLIFGLMAFAVGFSLAGHEINSLKAGQAKQGGINGPTIILGGFAATAVLTLVSHAGEGGRQFAVGLAVVTAVSSTLVYGGPVWDGLNKLFGSKPTTPISTTAVGATPTAPTHGTQTVAALAQVA